MNHIIITPAQAELIRGKHGKYSAIEPVPTPDGNFIIPEVCLNDPDLASIKAQIEAMRGNEQDIKQISEAVAEVGKYAQASTLVLCVDPTIEGYTFDTNVDGIVCKPVLTDSTFEADKETVKALTFDADENIRKLKGNIKNYVADLTDGVRTSATDQDVEVLINDGNIIITYEES
jgi:hypothetical protein